MNALAKGIGALRRLNVVLHYLAGAVLLAILAVTVVNIIGRQVNNPLEGSVEMTAVFMGVMVFLALSYGEDQRVHITVDLLYERLAPGPQRTLRLFGRAVAIVFTALMVWKLWGYAGSKATAGDETPVRQWPISPFVRVAAFGTLMLLISTLANFLADLFKLEGLAEEDSDEPDLEGAI